MKPLAKICGVEKLIICDKEEIEIYKLGENQLIQVIKIDRKISCDLVSIQWNEDTEELFLVSSLIKKQN